MPALAGVLARRVGIARDRRQRHRLIGSTRKSMQLPSSPSSGVPALDDALTGVFWGDNVVFRATDDNHGIDAFVRAFAEAAGYTLCGAVVFGEGRKFAGVTTSRRITVATADVDQAIVEVVAYGREIGPGGLIVFDDLTRLAAKLGEDGARRFFFRVCPSLLRIGVVACWALGKGVSDVLADAIHAITQVVVCVGPEKIVITKAEARPLNVVGTTLAYHVDAAGVPQVQVVSDAGRLGLAISKMRLKRGLSQAQIGGLAGVSPSAISQAERGLRGLSVSTLVRLATALGVTLDELIVGHSEPGYHIRGRVVPHHGGASRVALVDGGHADFRMYEFRLDPGAHGQPPAHPRGTELVLLGQGLLMITMTDGTTPVIRESEVLVASRAGVAEWRNLAEDQAMGFWLVV
ncbi:MAG: XRE family transcriptional regulator [Thermoleophilia bacterium]|nr:XRE family transcriptional regulator [Thermoleophilia bacterium]